MTVLLAIALLPLALLVALALRAADGGYPDEFDLGGLTVRFSALDRISYVIAVLAVAIGVVSGLAGIWLPAALFGRLAASAALLFVGAVLTLLLNRLMRGRHDTPS